MQNGHGISLKMLTGIIVIFSDSFFNYMQPFIQIFTQNKKIKMLSLVVYQIDVGQ